MDELILAPLKDFGLVGNDLNNDDISILQLKLWQLLSRRTGLYTMDDSSSVRVEIAQEMLTSICFLLGLYLKDNKLSPKYIVSADGEKVFNNAIEVIKKRIEQGKQLYQAACLSTPDIENKSLNDTLKSIGDFFRDYDYHYFSHQIPCEIDYQISEPVSETLYGIEYISEYLRRLIIENNLIRHFQKEKIIGLLNCYCQDYKGLLINLYEPILTNAIGLTIIRKDTCHLNITKTEQLEILEKLKPLTRKDTKSLLSKAAVTLSQQLRINNIAAQKYMMKTAIDLCPRIKSAFTNNNVDGIFLSW